MNKTPDAILRWLTSLSRRTVLVTAAALLALGFAAGTLWEPAPATTTGPEKLQLRLSGYQYINPLLDCEIGSELLEFSELRPFRGQIERLIRERSAKYRLTFVSVYFRDLLNGPWFGINEKAVFTPASLLKVPIMMACLKQAERDPAFLSKRIVNDVPEDLNRKQYIRPIETLDRGKSYPVEELIRRAIVQSDNNAAYLLGKAVDQQVLLRVFQDLGVNAPRLRLQYDFLQVKTYASFFRILFNSSYLERDASQHALQYLTMSSFRDGIVAGVPNHVLVAHKFGEYAEPGPNGIKQFHDCGIVYYPEHPYLLCIMSRGTDFRLLDDIIRDISALAYREVDRQFGQQAREAHP